VIDGGAVWLDDSGLSHFDRRHSRQHHGDARLVGFDLLAVGGDDIRAEPFHARKDRLAKLLAKSSHGIQLCEHSEIGSAIFEHAARLQARFGRNRVEAPGPSLSCGTV
jgi:bifunctional non-homologous end joining protein LigD